MSDPQAPEVTPTPPVTPPLPNDPASRTPDGTIKDASTSTPESTTTPTTPEPKAGDPPKAPEAGVVPEKYEFKAPEGYTLSDDLVNEITPIFKAAKIDAATAQTLMDFHAKQILAATKAPQDAVVAMREGWRTELKADAEIGSKLDEVKATIGKGIANLPAELQTSFKQAMDLTGAGDHPAFVKAFYKLSQMLNEGTSVTGGGPSPHGQVAPGKDARPSLAQAMYPNLASKS